MNAANLITLARLLSVPVTVWLIFEERWLPALALFIAAGLSDALDGYLAKHHDMKTELGAFLDPLADKTLLVSIYLVLGFHGHLPLWLVIMVVSRDLLIVGGILLSLAMGIELRIAPSLPGKVNTVVQIALAGTALGFLAGLPLPPDLLQILVYAVAITTVASGAGYLVNWTRMHGTGTTT